MIVHARFTMVDTGDLFPGGNLTIWKDGQGILLAIAPAMNAPARCNIRWASPDW